MRVPTRRTRTRLSRDQLARLEEEFAKDVYISKEDRDKLAEALGLTSEFVRLWFNRMRVKTGTTQALNLTAKQVQQWFQNQRTKTGTTQKTRKAVTI